MPEIVAFAWKPLSTFRHDQRVVVTEDQTWLAGRTSLGPSGDESPADHFPLGELRERAGHFCPALFFKQLSRMRCC